MKTVQINKKNPRGVLNRMSPLIGYAGEGGAEPITKNKMTHSRFRIKGDPTKWYAM